MAIKEDEVRGPLLEEENLANENGSSHENSKKHPWMVYLSTFVAVCGSYEFGSCVSFKNFFHDFNLSDYFVYE